MLGAFLDYISKTNLFNFIVFASIIAYILIKIDLISMLERGKNAVAQKIEVSTDEKVKSEENLQTIECKLSNLAEELEEIIKNSAENANSVGSKILADAGVSAENIGKNLSKLVENRQTLLKNDIMRRVSLASVEVAKNRIMQELSNNKDLHKKLIEESIEAIDGVEF